MEIAKERVSNIANVWKEMNEWDSMVGAMIYKLTEIYHDQDVAGTEDQDEVIFPSETSEILQILSGFTKEAISDDSDDRPYNEYEEEKMEDFNNRWQSIVDPEN